MKRFIILSVLVLSVSLMIVNFSIAKEPVELSIWCRGNPQYLEAYQALGNMFMEENSDIKLNFSLYEDLENKLLISGRANALPDAWIVDVVTIGRWVKYNLVKEINKESFKDADKILDVAWMNCQGDDGKYYGVPWSVQGQAMYYRKDWLNKFGLDVPETWEEMIEFAKKITYEDPDDNGKDDTYGIGVYGATKRGYAYWTFQDWIWQAGGSILKDVGKGKWVSNLDNEATRTALQFMHNMAYKYKILQPGFQTANSADVYGAFQDGAVGMVFHAGYRTLEYKARHGENLGTALMPAGPSGGYTLGEGENLYMSKNTKHPEEVLKWMEFMTSKEAQIFGITNDISNVCRISVRKDVDTAEVSGEPLNKAFVEVFQKGLVRFSEPIIDYYPVKLIAAELAQNVFLSEEVPDFDALLPKYDEKINEVLKEQSIYGG